MTPERLAELLVEAEPAVAPYLLAKNVALLLQHPNAFATALQVRLTMPDRQVSLDYVPGRQVSLDYVMDWLRTAALTEGAFWTEGASVPTFTPFGAAVLAETSRALAANVFRPTNVSLPTAAEDDYLRLDTILWQQAEGDSLDLATLLVLGAVASVALPSALTISAHAAQQLADTLSTIAGKSAATWQAEQTTLPATKMRSALDNWFGSSVATLPPSSPDHARLLMNWASALRTLYKATDDLMHLEAALARYTDAMALEPGFERDSPSHAELLMDCANALRDHYEASGNIACLEPALSCYATAADVLHGLAPGSHSQATLLMNWGSALQTHYERTGNIASLVAAVSHYIDAVRLKPGHAPGSPGRFILATILADALRAHYQATGDPGSLQAALSSYAEAANGNSGFAPGSPDHAHFLMNWANALRTDYHATGSIITLEAALARYADAAVLEPGFALGSRDHAGLLMYWGVALRAHYEATGSITSLEAALTRFTEAAALEPGLERGSRDHAGLLVNWANALGAHYEATGSITSLEAALTRFTEAAAAKPGFAPGSLDQVALLASSLVTLRAHYVAHGLLRSLAVAYECGRQAVELLEQQLLVLPERRMQLHLVDKFGRIYDHMVEICLFRAQLAAVAAEREEIEQEAWSYAERAKSRLTVQMLQDATLATPAIETVAMDGDSVNLVTALAICRQSITELLSTAEHLTGDSSRNTTLARSPAAREARAARLEELRSEETQLLAVLALANEDLSRLQQVNRPDLAGVQRALQALPDGAVLVELVPLMDQLVAFVLNGTSLSVHTLAVRRKALSQKTASFLSGWRGSGGSVRAQYDPTALASALAWLGEQLAPVLGEALGHLVASASPNRMLHVLLVPTGALHFWPLHALPLPGTSERLVDRVACSYLPSADALDALARQPAEPGPYRGFAPPTDLFFAPYQVRYEAARLGGEALLGTEASFEALQRHRGGSVVFATHGVADLEHPERSALYLAGEGGTTYPVTVLEFAMGLDRLGCGLLGLTACETHGAGVESGDTWGGLTRAFLRTGRTLLACLWPIDDAGTLALSVPFWDAVQQGLTIPQALRQAMRALRDADGYQFYQWGNQIVATLALSEEERRVFWEHWEDKTAATSDPIAGASVQPFQALAAWAPYLAIGWPGPLPAAER